MTTDSTDADDPPAPPPSPPRVRRQVESFVASPLAAAVGLVAAVAQVVDYLTDDKAGLVAVVVAALAALVCIVIGWRHRRSLTDRLVSVGWPGYLVYGCALVATVSVAAAVVTAALPGRTSAVPDAGPPPPVVAPSTTSAQATPPLADGVTCGSTTAQKVAITSIYAGDGGTTMGSDVAIAFDIHEPPTDGAYWLMSYADDVPRNLHHVIQKIVPGQTTARHTLKGDVGTHRQIYVAQSSGGSDAWFAENLAKEGDFSWDGNRVDLPPGAQKVSNVCDVVRKH